jgi:hypothetical protein
MNILRQAAVSMNRSKIDDLRARLMDIRIGPFELITAPENEDQYSGLIRAFWSPISRHYTGRFVSRYIRGFVALPSDNPPLGLQLISPHIFLYRSFANFGPRDLCYYAFRRSMFLRQNALNVKRNMLTERTIIQRTSDYVANGFVGQAINSLYNEEAEQVMPHQPA